MYRCWVGLSCVYVVLYDVFEVRNVELLGLFLFIAMHMYKRGNTNIKHTLISYRPYTLLYTYTYIHARLEKHIKGRANYPYIRTSALLIMIR